MLKFYWGLSFLFAVLLVYNLFAAFFGLSNPFEGTLVPLLIILLVMIEFIYTSYQGTKPDRFYKMDGAVPFTARITFLLAGIVSAWILFMF